MKLPALDLRLHHWGCVVGHLQVGAPGFVTSLGAAWDGAAYEDPRQRVKVTFLATRVAGPTLELVEPASEKSTVSRFCGSAVEARTTSMARRSP